VTVTVTVMATTATVVDFVRRYACIETFNQAASTTRQQACTFSKHHNTPRLNRGEEHHNVQQYCDRSCDRDGNFCHVWNCHVTVTESFTMSEIVTMTVTETFIVTLTVTQTAPVTENSDRTTDCDCDRDSDRENGQNCHRESTGPKSWECTNVCLLSFGHSSNDDDAPRSCSYDGFPTLQAQRIRTDTIVTYIHIYVCIYM